MPTTQWSVSEPSITPFISTTRPTEPRKLQAAAAFAFNDRTLFEGDSDRLFYWGRAKEDGEFEATRIYRSFEEFIDAKHPHLQHVASHLALTNPTTGSSPDEDF